MRLALAVLLWLINLPALAQEPSILIAYEERSEFVASVISHLETNLKDIATLSQFNISNKSDSEILAQAEHNLILTLGTRATDVFLDHNIRTPIISLLMPKQSWQKIHQDHKDFTNLHCIVLDQPVNRQLLLVDQLFNKQTAIGVVLGPYSLDIEKELENQAQRNRQILETRSIQSADQLMPALRDLLEEVDVLLALPDTLVYNKQTIQGILLLTYRHKIPLIGFSQAYSRAGAAVSIYSEPDQIARHATELVQDVLNKSAVDNMYYPKYFTVQFNQQVAKTLGMQSPDPAALVDSIMSQETNNK
jgi:ABC-type uncharacterized transport system substrate-binding protein